MEDLWRILEEGDEIPSKSVMFTIDDGFYDHHDVAASIFDDFGFPLNFFVITGLLDRELWPWDDQINYALHHASIPNADIQLPSGEMYSVNLMAGTLRQSARGLRNALKAERQEYIYDWLRAELYQKLDVEFPADIPQEYRPMSWDDARSLRARGHGVYPHTCSHRILSTLSTQAKHHEINTSLSRAKSELGYLPDVFAYPTGRLSDYDSVDIEELKKAGFKMAFNTVSNYVRRGQSQYELSRFSVPEDTAKFLQIVNRFEALNDWRAHHSPLAVNSFPAR
ncbi:polysaccharide deacetylase family protein [Marinobacter sp. NP-4(2019)]|uniref:polysaccharide deacetylase family protein n=1 Tax=Marinobacter sp. NP-4(2019) TaxID=2488665 RepID=UPI0013DF5BD5|nr:polysaccharide deacetylase family protein [Marinobacter sp. NP-4(2019)]